MRKIMLVLAAMVAVLALSLPALPAQAAVTWTPVWSSANTTTGFGAVPVPLGGFSDCNHNPDTTSAVCNGLPASLQKIWWAYPSGWPDTATQRGLAVGGTYQPQDTIWIANGAMHVKMFRCSTCASNEVGAALPLKALGVTYGKFVEKFNVSKLGAGFKSAHLLYPLPGGSCCENDFPEADWDGTDPIHAFSHAGAPGANQESFNTGVPFSGTTHTTTIVWRPGLIQFSFDGTVIGKATTAAGDIIPSQPMRWVLQNESALDGELSSPGETVQMNITSVQVFSCGSTC